MKFKTTAIALAMAGTIAAPMMAQAGDGAVYGSARIGIKNVDTGGVSETSIGGVASRFGIKGETDLGNGMAGFGRYEWGVSTEGSGVLSRRHAYVGLKGDFGSVLVGQTYHTFYNTLVGPLDIPWVGSGFAQVAYVGRTSEALTYAGGTDAISFGATLYMPADADSAGNGQESLNGYELGATFAIADMSLGVAVKEDKAVVNGADDPESIYGLTLHGVQFGSATFGIGYMAQDKDDSITAEVDMGNIYFHYEMMNDDVADNSPSIITLGYNQSLGANTMMWYEVHQYNADTNDSDDDITGLYATLKYDF
jgi:predicted porin